MDVVVNYPLDASETSNDKNMAEEGLAEDASTELKSRANQSLELINGKEEQMMQSAVNNDAGAMANNNDEAVEDIDDKLENIASEPQIDDVEYYTVPDDISKTVDEGPTQPRLEAYPRTAIGATRSRSFCANWFNRFPWLEYSISYDRVYCFACRHFNNMPDKPKFNDKSGTKYPLKKSATIYATTGFWRWAKAHERMRRHNSSARHIEAMGPWLQDTLKRENNGACPTNGAVLLAAANPSPQKSAAKSSVVKIECPLPSKRKRSRPTKKSVPANDVDDEQSGNSCPDWCTCTRCQDMSKMHECVCCCDVPEIRAKMDLVNANLVCITDHPGFSSVCLNHWVLQVAYYHHKQENGAPAVNEEFEKYRYIAYCQFVRWCWGVLKEDMHVPLPSCVVNRIKMSFQSDLFQHPPLDDLPIDEASIEED